MHIAANRSRQRNNGRLWFGWRSRQTRLLVSTKAIWRPRRPVYTADLLPILRARYPSDRLHFIVGGDSLVRSRWNRLESILAQLAALVVAPRGDVTAGELDAALADLDPQLRAKVRLLELPLVAESATLIRNRLAAGRSVRYLIPEPVYRYIEEWKLYH